MLTTTNIWSVQKYLGGNTDRQQFENGNQNVDVASPRKRSAEAHEWSCFSHSLFVTFVFSLITNCLFLYVLLISAAK